MHPLGLGTRGQEWPRGLWEESVSGLVSQGLIPSLLMLDEH